LALTGPAAPVLELPVLAPLLELLDELELPHAVASRANAATGTTTSDARARLDLTLNRFVITIGLLVLVNVISRRAG
jgi:hypothetical protein